MPPWPGACSASHCEAPADDRPGGAAEEESPADQPAAGPYGVGLPDLDHVVHEGLVQQRRAHPGPEAGDHPGLSRPAEGDRADAVDRDDPHRGPVLAEPACAPHQRSGGTGSDEEHVELGEPCRDVRSGQPVVCPPVVGVEVLVEPDVPLVARTEPLDVREPCAEEPALGVRLVEGVHLGAERFHHLLGGQIAAAVRDAHEPVALARRDHAERDARGCPRRTPRGSSRW